MILEKISVTEIASVITVFPEQGRMTQMKNRPTYGLSFFRIPVFILPLLACNSNKVQLAVSSMGDLPSVITPSLSTYCTLSSMESPYLITTVLKFAKKEDPPDGKPSGDLNCFCAAQFSEEFLFALKENSCPTKPLTVMMSFASTKSNPRYALMSFAERYSPRLMR